MVCRWIVLCAALNVLDDEIRDAAKTAGQPLRPPPKPGSAPALPRMVIPPMRRTSRDNGPPPLQQSLRPNTRSSPVGQPTPNGSASISSRSPDSSGSGSRRPQVPPQAAQQQAFSRQQQQQQQMYVPASGSNPGGQGQFQPPPRSLDQSMQGLNINTQVAQAQSRASPGPPGNMSAGSRRPQNPPQLQQHQLPPRNLPPGQQQQSASYRTVSAGRPQQRMSPPNGSYSASPPVSSSANGYISQPDARRQVSPPINESRGGRPMAASPPPPQSNGLSLPSQFTSAESSRPVSPRLPPPAGSPTGPRSLGPPRPGAMQAQSGSLPTGPRKMPSIGALNTRGRSPDPSSMPNGPRPMSPPIKSPSSASPTGLGGRGDGIPDSLKPRRAPPVFDDSELAYAN